MAGWTVVPNADTSAWTPVESAPRHDFSSLTANVKGEGTYKIKTHDGQTLDVPYSNVPMFTQAMQGTSFASPDEQSRFEKDAANDPKRPTFWNALTNPVGSGGREQGIAGGALQVGGQAIKALVQPVVHPIDTLKGVAKTGLALASQNPAIAGQEIVGPIVENYMSDKAAGGHALALENLGGQVLGGVEGGRMLGAVAQKTIPPVADTASDLAQKVKSYIRPTPAPSIVPRTEMAARQLSAAILPATKDASNFIKAAQEEVPNVLDYAKRTDNPLNTQLEFSKAAKGYAQEVLDLKNSIEAPVQGKVVKTTGAGFGSRMQEGPDTYATIGEIDKRITAINDELRAPRLNAGDTRAALAGQQGLQLEASRLRDILHRELADASGLTPEQVADIRQRAGRAYELANDTDAAVTSRMQAEGKTDMGPIHMSQLPSQAVAFARGGPTAIADRAFQRAIANFPGQSSSPPTANPPAPSAPVVLRPSLARQIGIKAEPNPLNPVMESPDAELFDRQLRLSGRGENIAEQNAKQASQAAADRMAKFLDEQRIEQLLSLARKQQNAARGYVKR